MGILPYSTSLFSSKLPFLLLFWGYDVDSDSAWVLLGFILWFSTLKGPVVMPSFLLVEKEQRAELLPWSGHGIHLQKICWEWSWNQKVKTFWKIDIQWSYNLVWQDVGKNPKRTAFSVRLCIFNWKHLLLSSWKADKMTHQNRDACLVWRAGKQILVAPTMALVIITRMNTEYWNKLIFKEKLQMRPLKKMQSVCLPVLRWFTFESAPI